MARPLISAGLSLALVAAPIAIAAHAQAAPEPPMTMTMTMTLPVSGRYAIDPTHTQVRATWNHLGLSRPGATFEHVTGNITLDAANPARSSVVVRIPIDGVDTGVPDLDAHFRSAGFFDVARFPEASFASRTVKFAGMGNAFTVEGDLTIKGVTKPVVLHAVLNGAGMHPMAKTPAAGFSATARVKRSDYGITAVIPLVSDEIDLVITAEATLVP